MTFSQMKTRAIVLYEELTSGDAPGFLDSDWGEIFTQAQYKVVNKILEDGIAKNSFNRRALDAIIKWIDFDTSVDDNVAGTTGSISAFADYDGTVANAVLVTSVAHGIGSAGTVDRLVISGTTNYNGTFDATVVDVDTFWIYDTWVSDDGTGTWTAPSIYTHPYYTNGWIVDISDTKHLKISEAYDIWQPLVGIADLDLNSTAYTDVEVKAVSFGEYVANRSNPFAKPHRDIALWSFPEDGALVVITNGEDLTNFHLQYVENIEKNPISNSTDCILHESVHPTIVDKAVQIAFKSIQDQVGFQLQALENQDPSIP